MHQILEEEIQKVEETFGKVVQLLSLQTICCPCHPECNEVSENIHSIRLRKNKIREGEFLFRADVFRNSLFDERFSKK